MPGDKALQGLPKTSLRARFARRREAFTDDDHAAAQANELLSLAISFIVTLFISFLLFGILGPDANAICDDTTNFTAEECDNATQARQLFWVFLVVVGVVHVLIALNKARGAVGGKR